MVLIVAMLLGGTFLAPAVATEVQDGLLVEPYNTQAPLSEAPLLNFPAVGELFRDSGANPQDPEGSRTVWRVLYEDSNGNRLIITEQVLGVTQYNTPFNGVVWTPFPQSNLRSVLNTAMVAPELAANALIPVGAGTDVRNAIGGSFSATENHMLGRTTPGGLATAPQQALFILSISEVNHYFEDAEARRTPEGASWWLRSPGTNNSTSCTFVQPNGTISMTQAFANQGLRPAMWVRGIPSSAILTVAFAPGAHGTLAGGTPNVAMQAMAGATIPAEVVPAVTPNEGFRFTGWAPVNPVGHVVTESIVFTAQYEPIGPPLVNVTFEAGASGTFADGATSVTIQVEAGSPIPAASVPVVRPNEGFNHIGWTPNAPAGHVVHEATIFTAQYEPREVQPGEIEVTFAAGTHGTLAGGIQTVVVPIEAGTAIPAASIPAVTPIAGFRHVGWTPHAPAGHVVNAPITFTAQYEIDPIGQPRPVPVTFAAGANGTLANGAPGITIEIMTGTAITAGNVPAVTPNAGFRHVGWAPHAPVGHVVSGEITFTAQYELIDDQPGEIAVTFAPGDHGALVGGTPNVTVQVQAGAAIPAAEIPAVTSHAGFRFVGWAPSEPAGYIVNTPTTFTAQYEPIGGYPSDCGIPGCTCAACHGDCACVEFHRAYMQGDTYGNFRPGASITRAEVAAILVRTHVAGFEAGTLPPGMAGVPFQDIGTHWARYYIAWAFNAGLVEGYGGSFRPNDFITRQEIAAILARAGGRIHQTGIIDVFDAGLISNWAIGYVRTVFLDGLMIGDANRNFRPLADITRAEVATAVNRMLNRIDSRNELATVVNMEAARPFPDVRYDAWFFHAVIAASNNHNLTRNEAGAINWKQLLP